MKPVSPRMAAEEADGAAFRDALLADPRLARIMSDSERFRAQVLLTEVVQCSGTRTNEENEDCSSSVHETISRRHAFREGAEYFYPASSVKLFGAVAACVAIRRLGKIHPGLDMDTPLCFGAVPPSEEIEEEPETETGPKNKKSVVTCLRRELVKLFVVSDNASFNRCFDIAGPVGIRNWHRKYLPEEDIAVKHRLRDGDDGDGHENENENENATLPSVFAKLGNDWVMVLDARVELLKHYGTIKGTASLRDAKHGTKPEDGYFFIGTSRVTSSGAVEDGPMDCSRKNRASLRALQNGLRLVMRLDERLKVDSGVNTPVDVDDLHPVDRAFLCKVASAAPRDIAKFGVTTAEQSEIETKPNAYPKFFLPGIKRAVKLELQMDETEYPEVNPDDDLEANPVVTITNKLGRAYGFSVDNAHVRVAWADEKDEGKTKTKNKKKFREFFLAAVVETNANQTVNDDLYEYEETADPWFEALGETCARFVWSRE